MISNTMLDWFSLIAKDLPSGYSQVWNDDISSMATELLAARARIAELEAKLNLSDQVIITARNVLAVGSKNNPKPTVEVFILLDMAVKEFGIEFVEVSA